MHPAKPLHLLARRARPTERGVVAVTIVAGSGVLGVAGAFSPRAPLVTVVLLLGAAIAAEALQVAGDDDLPGEGRSSPFSCSLGIHITAVLVLGVWHAAMIAAAAVVIVDGLGGARRRTILFNASVFAIAAAAGGLLYFTAGGSPGSLQLPEQLPAIVVLVSTVYVVNLGLVSAVVSAGSDERFLRLLTDTAKRQSVSIAGEMSIGIAAAIFALRDPWSALTLVPLVFAVYLAHARIAAHRRETADALRTFASVIDDRDPYTAGHSNRVATHVEELARALSLPASDVIRLRWAARLHDLGKVAVDNAILHKPVRLNGVEWEIMRSHPLISARVLRRFRLASGEARAVELHHERYDGAGYFHATEVPLAAHFLIVADTYDAMTSDRPYRKGMAPADALAEIERNIGSQFHPLVARAFVALQRGLPIEGTLTAEETRALRTIWTTGKHRKKPPQLLPLLHSGPPLVVLAIGACIALALGSLVAAGAFGALAVAGAVVRQRTRHLVGAGADRLVATLLADEPLAWRLSRFAEALGAEGDIAWVRLIGQRGAGASRLARPTLWASGEDANESDVLRWLQRDGDPSLVVVADGEGPAGALTYLALPLLGADDAELHLVAAFRGRPAEPVLAAVSRCCLLHIGVEIPRNATPQLAIAS